MRRGVRAAALALAYTDNSRDSMNRRGVTIKDKPELIYFTKQRSGMRFFSRRGLPGRC
jgi:hypothetical protein